MSKSEALCFLAEDSTNTPSCSHSGWEPVTQALWERNRGRTLLFGWFWFGCTHHVDQTDFKPSILLASLPKSGITGLCHNTYLTKEKFYSASHFNWSIAQHGSLGLTRDRLVLKMFWINLWHRLQKKTYGTDRWGHMENTGSEWGRCEEQAPAAPIIWEAKEGLCTGARRQPGRSRDEVTKQ